jgi:hypothetical protein
VIVGNAKHCVTALEAYTTCWLAVQRHKLCPNKLSQEPELDVSNPIVAFLSSCYPAMTHLVPAFEKLGVTDEVHLQGLSRWTAEQVRDFFNRRSVGCSPFETEIVINQLAVVTH